MTNYQTPDFKGDDTYLINCTGDACIGDEVAFERATFTGSFRSPKFNGFEKITGKIIRDSYGKDKQQHTFTLELNNGDCLRIKGRNLYANGLYRKKLNNEQQRQQFLLEKHKRGDIARLIKKERKENLLKFGF